MAFERVFVACPVFSISLRVRDRLSRPAHSSNSLFKHMTSPNKNRLMVLALVSVSVSVQAQTPNVGSTFEVIGSAGANGSAIFGHASLYPQPIAGNESSADLQVLDQAAKAVTREACAVPAAQLEGRNPRLFAYRMEILEVRTIDRQTRRQAAAGKSQPEAWVRVVHRPQPACTGWMRADSAVRSAKP